MVVPKITGDQITWNEQGKSVNIMCKGAKFAIYNPDNQLIYVILQNSEEEAASLNVYKPDGFFVASPALPDGFSIYYMLPYSEFGVSIICSTENPNELRPDWHFKFDIETNSLIKHCPAY